MRKMLFGGLVGVLGLLALGAGANLYTYVLATPGCPWYEIGSITAAQAYPAVGERDYNDVTVDINDAKSVFWLDIPQRANGVQLRYQTTADGDSTTVAILVAADDYLAGSTTYDDFMYGGQHVLTGGTQVGSHSNVYVDTITATDGVLDWSVTDSGNNRIAVTTADIKGLKRLAIIATTLQASSTLYVHARFY
jgi:hypothetical protein